MPTTTSAVADIAAKFREIIDFQESERGLIERRTQLHVVQVALLSRAHIILHGNPGVAKSMTVDGLLMHMPDLRLFKTQAYKASPPEQFLGPISIKRMAEDEFVRITTRRIADCEVAFIDELPRAPRAMLPAFQGMMVEREFDSGNGPQRVPLMSMIGTSNHLPEDEELGAFFDRFAFKLVVKAPQSQANFVAILQGALERRAKGEPDIPDELMVWGSELAEIQAAVDRCHIPTAILEKFGELWANLLGAGIEPSIRRYVDVTRGMQAVAVLDGRDEVTEDDLQVAQHCLWTSEDEISTVYAEVVKFASEWVKGKSELLDSFTETLDRLGKIQSAVAAGASLSDTLPGDTKSLTDSAIKLVSDQRRLSKLITDHIASGDTTKHDAELEASLDQMQAGKAWVQDRVMGGLEL